MLTAFEFHANIRNIFAQDTSSIKQNVKKWSIFASKST